MSKVKILFAILFLLVLSFSIYKYVSLNKDIEIEHETQEELITVSEIEDIPSENSTINFEELQKINPDVIGWLYIENTNINYPLVQGNDNTYYLSHSYYKKYSAAGSIYMDTTASSDFTSFNTFIYGHYTPYGTMFAEIGKYMNQQFYEQHKNIYIYTPNKNYKLEVFSVHTDKASSKSYQMNFTTDAAFSDYVNLMIKKSVIKTDVKIDPEVDKIITFYSCSKERGYAKDDRYFIHTKLIEL